MSTEIYPVLCSDTNGLDLSLAAETLENFPVNWHTPGSRRRRQKRFSAKCQAPSSGKKEINNPEGPQANERTDAGIDDSQLKPVGSVTGLMP